MIKNFDWKLSSKVFLLLGLCIGCHHSFSYAQQSSALKNVEVKIDCSLALSKVEKYCVGVPDKPGKPFSDSSNPPGINWGPNVCICDDDRIFWQCNSNVYKHTLPSGEVRYSSSDDPKRFARNWSFSCCPKFN